MPMAVPRGPNEIKLPAEVGEFSVGISRHWRSQRWSPSCSGCAGNGPHWFLETASISTAKTHPRNLPQAGLLLTSKGPGRYQLSPSEQGQGQCPQQGVLLLPPEPYPQQGWEIPAGLGKAGQGWHFPLGNPCPAIHGHHHPQSHRTT